MRSNLIRLLGVFVISIASVSAHAEKETERFIPLGKSPGVSGVSSYIGEISAVDTKKRTITITEDKALRSVAITDRTKIWLDLSKYRAANIVGTIEDCKKGRQVEVKTEAVQQLLAEWIKVVPEKAP